MTKSLLPSVYLLIFGVGLIRAQETLGLRPESGDVERLLSNFSLDQDWRRGLETLVLNGSDASSRLVLLEGVLDVLQTGLNSSAQEISLGNGNWNGSFSNGDSLVIASQPVISMLQSNLSAGDNLISESLGIQGVQPTVAWASSDGSLSNLLLNRYSSQAPVNYWSTPGSLSLASSSQSQTVGSDISWANIGPILDDYLVNWISSGADPIGLQTLIVPQISDVAAQATTVHAAGPVSVNVGSPEEAINININLSGHEEDTRGDDHRAESSHVTPVAININLISEDSQIVPEIHYNSGRKDGNRTEIASSASFNRTAEEISRPEKSNYQIWSTQPYSWITQSGGAIPSTDDLARELSGSLSVASGSSSLEFDQSSAERLVANEPLSSYGSWSSFINSWPQNNYGRESIEGSAWTQIQGIGTGQGTNGGGYSWSYEENSAQTPVDGDQALGEIYAESASLPAAIELVMQEVNTGEMQPVDGQPQVTTLGNEDQGRKPREVTEEAQIEPILNEQSGDEQVESRQVITFVSLKPSVNQVLESEDSTRNYETQPVDGDQAVGEIYVESTSRPGGIELVIQEENGQNKEGNQWELYQSNGGSVLAVEEEGWGISERGGDGGERQMAFVAADGSILTQDRTGSERFDVEERDLGIQQEGVAPLSETASESELTSHSVVFVQSDPLWNVETAVNGTLETLIGESGRDGLIELNGISGILPSQQGEESWGEDVTEAGQNSLSDGFDVVQTSLTPTIDANIDVFPSYTVNFADGAQSDTGMDTSGVKLNQSSHNLTSSVSGGETLTVRIVASNNDHTVLPTFETSFQTSNQSKNDVAQTRTEDNREAVVRDSDKLEENSSEGDNEAINSDNESPSARESVNESLAQNEIDENPTNSAEEEDINVLMTDESSVGILESVLVLTQADYEGHEREKRKDLANKEEDINMTENQSIRDTELTRDGIDLDELNEESESPEEIAEQSFQIASVGIEGSEELEDIASPQLEQARLNVSVAQGHDARANVSVSQNVTSDQVVAQSVNWTIHGEDPSSSLTLTTISIGSHGLGEGSNDIGAALSTSDKGSTGSLNLSLVLEGGSPAGINQTQEENWAVNREQVGGEIHGKQDGILLVSVQRSPTQSERNGEKATSTTGSHASWTVESNSSGTKGVGVQGNGISSGAGNHLVLNGGSQRISQLNNEGRQGATTWSWSTGETVPHSMTSQSYVIGKESQRLVPDNSRQGGIEWTTGQRWANGGSRIATSPTTNSRQIIHGTRISGHDDHRRTEASVGGLNGQRWASSFSTNQPVPSQSSRIVQNVPIRENPLGWNSQIEGGWIHAGDSNGPHAQRFQNSATNQRLNSNDAITHWNRGVQSTASNNQGEWIPDNGRRVVTTFANEPIVHHMDGQMGRGAQWHGELPEEQISWNVHHLHEPERGPRPVPSTHETRWITGREGEAANGISWSSTSTPSRGVIWTDHGDERETWGGQRGPWAVNGRQVTGSQPTNSRIQWTTPVASTSGTQWISEHSGPTRYWVNGNEELVAPAGANYRLNDNQVLSPRRPPGQEMRWNTASVPVHTSFIRTPVVTGSGVLGGPMDNDILNEFEGLTPELEHELYWTPQSGGLGHLLRSNQIQSDEKSPDSTVTSDNTRTNLNSSETTYEHQTVSTTTNPAAIEKKDKITGKSQASIKLPSKQTPSVNGIFREKSENLKKFAGLSPSTDETQKP